MFFNIIHRIEKER